MKAQLCSCPDRELRAKAAGGCTACSVMEGEYWGLCAADSLAGQAGIRGESLWLPQVQTFSLQRLTVKPGSSTAKWPPRHHQLPSAIPPQTQQPSPGGEDGSFTPSSPARSTEAWDFWGKTILEGFLQSSVSVPWPIFPLPSPDPVWVWKCCRKGVPFQGPKLGSCLTLGNELSEETHVLTKQEILLGKGAGVERSRIMEPRRTALPRGIRFRVVFNNHFNSESFLVVHTLFSQDGCQRGGFWEVVR